MRFDVVNVNASLAAGTTGFSQAVGPSMIRHAVPSIFSTTTKTVDAVAEHPFQPHRNSHWPSGGEAWSLKSYVIPLSPRVHGRRNTSRQALSVMLQDTL